MNGGQGTVEIKIENGIRYACKHLLDGINADADSVYRFEREISIAEKINNPNVIRILNHGKDENGFFYNMPVYQRSLLDYIIENHSTLYFNANIQKTIFLAILSGVEALHKNGIIHRDLKPDNVLMNGLDDIVICDFGFSKDLNNTCSFTNTGEAFGTQNYISPEQAIDSKNVDFRTDIYALGQILNDLSGRMGGYAPIHIQQVADKATSYNMNDRYSNICELREAVIGGYDVWLKVKSGMTVKQMIEAISSGRIDNIELLGYVNTILNNDYYSVGDALTLSQYLSEVQYIYLESTHEDLCLKMFEYIWDDFYDTWNNAFNKIDDMTSLVRGYWELSKSNNVKGLLLGKLVDLAREGNRFSAMETMANLISEMANEPFLQSALLRNTKPYTIKENYKRIGKIPPTWI